MMRSVRLAPLLLAVTCIACVSRIDVEFDEAEDFSGYRTWAWLPRAQTEPMLSYRRPEPVLEALIVEGIERELDARGFPRAEGQPPDFFVTYHLRVKRELVGRLWRHGFASTPLAPARC